MSCHVMSCTAISRNILSWPNFPEIFSSTSRAYLRPPEFLIVYFWNPAVARSVTLPASGREQSVVRYQFWQPGWDLQSDYTRAGSRGEISWTSSPQWPRHLHHHHHMWQSSSVFRKMMNHNKNVSIQSWNLLSPPVDHSLSGPQPSSRIAGWSGFSGRRGKPQQRPEQYLHGLG